MWLVFFVTEGNFLSDIAVTVSDSEGMTLVETTTTGPWLILNLSAGTYTVRAARRNGDVQSMEIQVSDAVNNEFGFMFPEP
jgi:hypothetical protein|tara:strand:- start:239 stop:481 length:243 start_codon:yes stop_codon:yes gene_type:complete